MTIEHRCVEVLNRFSPRVMSVCSGIGAERAAAATREVIEAGARTVVSFGFAGALSPLLKAGDILIPQHVIDLNGHSQRTVPFKFDHPRIVDCPSLLTTPAPIVTENDKANLHQTLDVSAVDMESYAIGVQTNAANLDFLVLRAVADEARVGIPGWVNDAVDERGDPISSVFLSSLMRKPTRVCDLMVLSKSAQRAKRSLKAAVGELASQLDVAED